MVTVALQPFRVAQDGGSLPLDQSGESWLCEDGDRLLFVSTTSLFARLKIAGTEYHPRHIDLTSEGSFRAEFVVPIESWAGRVNVVLEQTTDGAPELVGRCQLEIRPKSSKLSENEYDAMLQELSNRSRALPWGLSAGGAVGRLDRDAPSAVHPSVIESQLPLLSKLLLRFLATPPTVALRMRELRAFQGARRTDIATLRWLGKRANVLHQLRGDDKRNIPGNPRTRIDQQATSLSLNHPITRFVAFLLHRVRSRLQQTANELERGGGRRFRDENADAYARQLAKQVVTAREQVDQFLAVPLFRHVKPEPANDSVIQAMADDPLLSALNRVCRRLMDPGLAYAPGENLESALKKTYDLFELLVLYRLVEKIDEFAENGWKATIRRELKVVGSEQRPADGARWSWKSNNGFRLHLRYQQSFMPMRTIADKGNFKSLSGMRIPDYIIEVFDERGGSKQRILIEWAIIDAKYRSGRSALLDGLGDLHRYRDALLLRNRKAKHAYVVAPHVNEELRLQISNEYLKEYSFGIMSLFDDKWFLPIESWISSIVLDQR